MGKEARQVQDWAPPPLRNSSSPMSFENTFNGAPIIDLTASDALSTTTLAGSSTTTLNSSTEEESTSSLRTTPEIDGGEQDLSKRRETLELTDQVTKQIESEAAQVQNTVAADKSAATRRRSMRIKTKDPLTTTIADSASPSAAPDTPRSRSKAPHDTPSASTDATVTKRSLRSATKRSMDDSQTDLTDLSPPPESEKGSNASPKGSEPPKDTASTRRVSKRISAINSHVTKPAPTPKSGTKRARDTVEKGAATATSKYKRTKLQQKEEESESSEEDSDESSEESELESESEAESEAEEPLKARRTKVWIDQGLYVGQEDCDLKLRPATKGKKAKGKKPRPHAFPLPIFRGKEIMETQRDFKLPHFVFAPSAFKVTHPSDWRKLNHNQLIGDAQQIWRKEKPPNVKCVCVKVCDVACLNRCTWVECTDNTCDVGRHCSNRPFADLLDRVKTETRFATGVEVAQTENRGYGLRALRSFEPFQIIVEYTGEIITQEESERRLDEVYKDNQNYYLMVFDQNMILDATRGSVARFVNHSCDPNCSMEKWVVEGRPRMALFAGKNGIEAGDELTYDYNFTWFKGVTQTKCRCGSEACRGVLGKRSDNKRLSLLKAPTPPKKQAKQTKRKYKKRVQKTTVVQKSIIISPAKPKRAPPKQRRPPTPPPKKTKSSSPPATPELEPLSDSSDDESELSDIDFNTSASVIVAPDSTPASAKPTNKALRPRTRVMKTYKVNKTIAKSSVAKTATSKGAVQAARLSVLEQVLDEKLVTVQVVSDENMLPQQQQDVVVSA
ncbi:hypothetical protein BZA77DRAFT_133501 [Pyronema omphalodes]|nr:hypothetical protein BZA77DRAFT_133501 [Pyronema omphalodes]